MLVHGLSVYFPVRPRSLEPAQRNELLRFVIEYLSAFKYARQCPGMCQNVVLVCPGHATVCDGTFPV